MQTAGTILHLFALASSQEPYIAKKPPTCFLLSLFRGSLLPDPRYDAVRCIVLSSASDIDDIEAGCFPAHIMLFDSSGQLPVYDAIPDAGNSTYEVFKDELSLIQQFIKSVVQLDPDIMLGFEIQQQSIGYLIDRANLLEINLLR